MTMDLNCQNDIGRTATRCVELLIDDYARQGNHLSFDDVTRVLSRRNAAPNDWSAVLERLAVMGVTIADPVAAHPEGHEQEHSDDFRNSALGADLHERDYLKEDYWHHELLNHEEEIQLGRRYQAARNIGSGAEGPDENVAQILETGLRAREALILSNIRLVFSCAKPFMTTSPIPPADLVQEGLVGLMRAVEKYNPELGYRFSTYASWWINQSIRRALSDQGHLIRVPESVNRKINHLKRKIRRLAVHLGRSPTSPELAHELGCDIGEVNFLLQIKKDAQSLDDGLDGVDEPYMHGPRRGRLESPTKIVEREELKQLVEQVVSSLDSRTKLVLTHRFGLLGNKPRTLEQVGRKLGITRERVRQIEKKALKRIGHSWRATKLRPYAEDGGGCDV